MSYVILTPPIASARVAGSDALFSVRRLHCLRRHFVEHANELPHTRISLDVNGSLRQDSTLGKLIWSVPEIIEHLSKAWELAPGDLIFTGTPEGVNAVGRGDLLTAKVDGVGALRVRID